MIPGVWSRMRRIWCSLCIIFIFGFLDRCQGDAGTNKNDNYTIHYYLIFVKSTTFLKKLNGLSGLQTYRDTNFVISYSRLFSPNF